MTKPIDKDEDNAFKITYSQKGINVYFDNAKRNSYALRSHCMGFFKNITRKIAEEYKWEPK